MLMQLGAVTQKRKIYMRKIKQQNDSEAILIKGVGLSFPTNRVEERFTEHSK